jgi:TrmH family RNA methyltransferase
VFVVEGHRQVRAALDAGVRVRELLYAPELFLGDADEEVVRRCGAHALRVSPAAFASVSANVRPDGLLAVVARWPTDLDLLRDDSLVLVAEAVERPGNLGTIVRTACAAGASALVVADPRTDVFHPETVRGSVGTLFRLPVHVASTRAAVERLARTRIVVATPDAPTPAWAAHLDGPLTLVVGSERHGVSRAWLDAADELVSIPMPGPADSINVAVAAGVVLYEAARARHGARQLAHA